MQVTLARKIVFCFFLVMAAGLLLIGLSLLYPILKIKKNGLTTSGVITAIQHRYSKGIKNSGGGTYYTYQFTAKDSFRYEGHNMIHADEVAIYKTGDIVEIIYNPDNPYNNRINTFNELYLPGILSGALSFVFFVIALIMYRKWFATGPGK